jgi:hypothetical protein
MYTGPEQMPEAKSIEQLLSWLPTVAETLDYIHGKGYVHRDIKPHNILFDGDDKPFLGDLGIARILAATPGDGGALTRLGERPPGTPPYMSPEQICGQTGGAWSDQFALAVIVYEWLTGRRPFAGMSAEEVFDSQRERLKPLHSIRRDIPERVSAVVEQALSRRPADRFPTCMEFVSELSAAQGNKKMEALTGKATRIATSLSGPARPVQDDLGVPVDNEPNLPANAGTSSPATLPLSSPAAAPAPVLDDDLRFRVDMYNEQQSLPAAPPLPESPPIVARTEKSVLAEPSTVHPTVGRVGRVLSWSLAALLLLAAGFGASFLLPGTQAQQCVTDYVQPVESRERPGKDQAALERLKLDVERQLVAARGDIARETERAKNAEEHAGRLEKEMKKLGQEAEKLRTDIAKLVKENAEIGKARDRDGKEIKRLEKAKEEIDRLNKKLEETGKERDVAKNRAAEASRQSRSAEAEKDRSKRGQEEAERLKVEAERKYNAVQVESAERKERLTEMEQALKQTKLWFVLKNATDSSVRYYVRWQLWTGKWSEWKESTIAKKETKAISAPRGSMRIEVVYNTSLVPGEPGNRVRGINAQSYRHVATPEAKDIDAAYTFKVSKDRKKLLLTWCVK